MVRHCIVKGYKSKGSEVTVFSIPVISNGINEKLNQLSVLRRRKRWHSDGVPYFHNRYKPNIISNKFYFSGKLERILKNYDDQKYF